MCGPSTSTAPAKGSSPSTSASKQLDLSGKDPATITNELEAMYREGLNPKLRILLRASVVGPRQSNARVSTGSGEG